MKRRKASGSRRLWRCLRTLFDCFMLNRPVLGYSIVVSCILSVLLGLLLLVIAPFFASRPLLLLALPLAGIFCVMLVIAPKVTFLALFLSRPLLDVVLNMTRMNIGGQDVGVGAVLNLVIIVLGVFLIFYEKSFPRENRVVACWTFFLLVMLAATAYSPFVGRAVRLYANYLSYFVMFLIPFLIIKTKEDFRFWVKIFAWSFALPVLFANLDLLRGGQFYADAGMRIKGTFTHPNILAFYLSLGITFYFYLLKSRIFEFRSIMVWGLRLFMVNMIVLLIATKTRNAWIACFSSFLIYGFLKDKKTLLVLLLIIPVTLALPQVRDRVATIFNGQSSVSYRGINSFEWRLRMWQSSFPQIAQRPLQGHGLTSFVGMSQNFSDVGGGMGAHNVYVETIFESGIIGLLSLLALLAAPLLIFLNFMRTASNSLQAQVWAIAAGYMISYIAIGSADNLSYYLVFNWYVWFFIGLMILAEKLMVPATANEKNLA